MRSMAMVEDGRRLSTRCRLRSKYTFRSRNADSGAIRRSSAAVRTQRPFIRRIAGGDRKGESADGMSVPNTTLHRGRDLPSRSAASSQKSRLRSPNVYDAQEAVGRATKPVRRSRTFAYRSRYMADGLLSWSHYHEGTGRDVVIPRLGHWLGMNVSRRRTLQRAVEGRNGFTNEPGIYIREDTLDNLADTPENKHLLKGPPAFEKYKTSACVSKTICLLPIPAVSG